MASTPKMVSTQSRSQGDKPLTRAEARDMTESQRSLETKKYLPPVSDQVKSTSEAPEKDLDNDGALHAYAETLLLRLDGSHVTISLIDRGEQHFLVGANREQSQVQLRECVGCKALESLCQETLKLESNGEHSCFIINDLQNDERVKGLPTTGLRFFAGTPIATADHRIGIGAIFFFDDRPRDGLTIAQSKLIWQTAANVMKHLEIKREAAERRRLALMSLGVRQFLEKTKRNVESKTGDTPSSEDGLEDQSNQPEKGETGSKRDTDSPKLANASDRDTVLNSIRATLHLATEILSSSLELSDGGVIFLDANVSQSATGDTDADWDGSPDAGDILQQADCDLDQTLSHRLLEYSEDLSNDEQNERMMQNQIYEPSKKRKPCKVLAMSVADSATWGPDNELLDSKSLQGLIDSYSQGNIWYLDHEGYFSSLEQSKELMESSDAKAQGRRNSVAPRQMAKQQAEATMLSRVFHHAKQIMFLPIWNAAGSQWYAGCFIWSQSPTPVFAVDSDIAYLSSLTNSVMVEISRLDALTANKMKSDFISSISHEFRSPLHGILASAEFLRESELDASQLEWISTILNCSGTLLDTINHVLDYSKINSFEDNTEGVLSSELYQVTNLGLLCEDTISGMIAANGFRDLESRDAPTMIASEDSYSRYSVRTQQDPVKIVIAIESQDWNYRVQPGAIRRIIMNIFGNAQKYTSHGKIIVELKKISTDLNTPSSLSADMDLIKLIVRDSGKGMSADYMERKLFHPFSQEDSFSAGVGLGLSIVRSIVNQLGGRINIHSVPNKGTDVEVTLPVQKLEAANQKHHHSSSPVNDQDVQVIIKTLQDRASEIRVRIHPGLHTAEDGMLQIYCSEWFGLTVIDGTDESTEPDLTITDQHYDWSNTSNKGRILMLHEHVGYRREQRDHDGLIGQMTLPVGPYKLARCIMSLFEKDMPKFASQVTTRTSDVGTQTPMASPGETFTDATAPMSDYFMAPPVTPPPLPLTREECGETDPETPRQSQASAKTAKDSLAQTPPIVHLRSNSSNLTSTLNSLKTLNIELTPAPAPTLSGLPSNSTTSSFFSQSISSVTTSPALHILAVDDNALNLRLLHRFLQKRQFDTIVLAKNGQEAVDAVKKAAEEEGRSFDVLFMDISMPVMDGFEATRMIRSFERATWKRRESIGSGKSPTKATFSESGQLDGSGLIVGNGSASIRPACILALTGLASRRDRDTADACGFDHFFTKPVDFEKVTELLTKLGEEKARLSQGASRGGRSSTAIGSPI